MTTKLEIQFVEHFASYHMLVHKSGAIPLNKGRNYGIFFAIPSKLNRLLCRYNITHRNARRK